MRVFATLALSCFILSSTPALAKDDKAADPDKKSCRRIDTTGSILGGKLTCHTKEEWKQIDAANARSADNMRDPMRGRMGAER